MRIHSRRNLVLLACVVAALVALRLGGVVSAARTVPSPAIAPPAPTNPVTYSYIGNPLANCTGEYTGCDAGTRVTGWMTLPAALDPNLLNAIIQPMDYRFTDARGATLGASDAPAYNFFQVSTDQSGNITRWTMYLGTTATNGCLTDNVLVGSYFVPFSDLAGDYSCYLANQNQPSQSWGAGQNQNRPGVWRMQPAESTCAVVPAGTFCQPVADGDVSGLIAAILAANTRPGPDTITLAVNGTYDLVSNYDATNGLPPIAGPLTLSGNGATIRRSAMPGTPEFRILTINTGQAADVVTLSNVTLGNGKGSGDFQGGAIRKAQGSLEFTDSAIYGSSAAWGGGIWNYKTGSLAIANSYVLGNVADDPAQGGAGGGLYNYEGAVTITNSYLDGNLARNSGGIFNYQGPVTMVDSSVSANATSANGTGGGLTALNGLVNITGGVISRNTARDGAGIFNSGTVNIVNATISGNTAAIKGGGVYSQTGSVLTVNGSTISGNLAHSAAAPTSGYGGGIFIWSGANATISNSTVALNQTNFAGGGLYNNGSLTLINATIWGNISTQYASGLASDSSATTTLANTLLAQNVGGKNCRVFGPAITSNGYNLSDDGTCAAYLTQTGDLNDLAAGMAPAGLADNGGPTLTVAIEAVSPARDAGDDIRCAASPVSSVDQRGVARPQGARCDIGSFEAPPPPDQPQTITFTSTPPALALVGATYVAAATGGGSGNPMVFSSLTPVICTVAGDIVTLQLVGTCTIAANQAGGVGYLDAAQQTQTFQVTPFTQTRTWYNVTAAGPAPPARAGHRMVYDSLRNKVILFGGQTTEGCCGGEQNLTGVQLNDMWEWDSTTLTWTEVFPASGPTPAPRSFHGMAYDPIRDRVILYGGKRGAVYYATDGETWEWNPATRIWTLFSGATTLDYGGRRGAQLAFDPNLGKIILFGGEVYWGEKYGNTWVWENGNWTQLPMAGPSGRTQHTLTTDVARSRVVLYGGDTQTGTPGDTWEWNGSAWTQVSSSPLAQKVDSGAAYDPYYGQTVLFGGGSTNAGTLYNTTFGWAGGAWTQIVTAANPPALETVLAFDGERIVMFGGRASSGTTNQTWVLAPVGSISLPQTISFTSAAPNPGIVGTTYNIAAAGGGSGNAIVFSSATPGVCSVAGSTVSFLQIGTCTIAANQAGGNGYLPAQQAVQTMDVMASQSITFTSSPPNPANVGMTYNLTVIGGGSGNPIVLTSLTSNTCSIAGTVVTLHYVGTCTIAANQAGGAGYLDAPQSTQTFAVTPFVLTRNWYNVTGNGPGPSARGGHRMVYDSRRDRVILFGGQDATGQQLNDLWEWDGASLTWTNVVPISGPVPQARSFFGMAYDVVRDRVVIYGGQVGPFISDTDGSTWEWNPASRTWTFFGGATTLDYGGRRGSQLAFDPNLGKVILFGGRVYWGEQYGNTSVWQNGNWTQLPNAGPSGRMGHVMTTDLARSKVVLYGGWTGSYVNDTWEWNGSGWTQVAVPGLSQSSYAAAAYDPFYGASVLYGGSTGSTFFDTTYERAESGWTQVQTTVRPPALQTGAMTFDGRRLVMFGGGNSSGTTNQTWVLAPASAAPLYQTITFTSTPPNPALLGGSYSVGATGGASGNPVTFTALTTAVCTVSGSTVSLVAIGTCTIAADQAGADLYLAAPRVTQSFAVTSMPSITVPADMVLEATGPGGAIATFQASATDIADPSPSVSCSPASGALFPLGSTTVACTATNTFGNTASGNFTVLVRDTTSPSLVAMLFPSVDTILASNAQTVVVLATDTVGVARATVNGIPLVLDFGTGVQGQWRGDIPVTPLAANRLDVTVEDASSNLSSISYVIDSDGIAGEIDRARLDYQLSEQSTFTSDFNDGTTSGTLSRVGPVMTARPSRIGQDAYVRVSMTTLTTNPAYQSSETSACPGVLKTFVLDVPGEEADVRCIIKPFQPTSIKVVAARALPTIEVYKHRRSCGLFGCRTYIEKYTLRTGDWIMTGSPAEAGPDNTAPIQVEISRVNDDGSQEVIGSYELDPGEAVDVEIEPGATPIDDQLVFSVLEGEVAVTLGDDTVTVAEGESITSRVDQLAQSIAFDAIATQFFGAASFALNAIATSGLPISYTATGACTVSGGTLTVTGTGTCSVTASQPGDLSYLAAAPVTRTFAIWHSWSGLLQPVNSSGTSVFKRGSTVPLKFQLTGGSAGITDLAARVYIAKVSNEVVGTEVEATMVGNSDAGNLFRYDPATGQYTFNWGTKDLSEGTWQIRVDLLDGNVSRVVMVSLKK